MPNPRHILGGALDWSTFRLAPGPEYLRREASRDLNAGHRYVNASDESYASANPTFPHESTADQFFGEEQFEAYRGLGEHSVRGIEKFPGLPEEWIA